MRILLVNHTFPPASYAGSEICVLNTAKEFLKRGHDVAVFYRIHDPSREEYSLLSEEYEGVETFALNHTYRGIRTFQEIYVNSAIAARFAFCLHQWKPDIVHFHHLTNLSLSMVDEVKAYGAPVIMTLHDYWLLCQRGQLLKRDLSLCSGPSLEKCRSCLAPQLLRGISQRLVSRLVKKEKIAKPAVAGRIDLLGLRYATVQTDDRRFVTKTCFEMGDQPEETLLSHPNSEISYAIQCEKPCILHTSIGMHPATYDREGGGVCFQIERNGEILFSRLLNPKKKEEDRGWYSVQIELNPSPSAKDILVLRTLTEKGLDNRFCTAGWWKPQILPIHSSQDFILDYSPRKQQIHSLLYQAMELLTEGIAAFSQTAEEGILHRHRWVRHILNQVDFFLSPSCFLRDFFIQNGLSSEKIAYLDNGFLPTLSPSNRVSALPLRFGYIGTWIPSKGVDIAIQAFQSIDPREARLIVHGFFPGYDGFENYESYLRSLSGTSVEWRGRYQPDQIDSLLSDLDALIMPSIWWENSPLTIHEAFLSGVPVITADVGGMAELVRNGGGLTFQHRNRDSLRNVIRTLIHKPSILNELRKTIPPVQSMQGYVDRLMDLYRHWISRSKVEEK